MIEIYTDGSKSPSGVGSGIAIFLNKHLTLQLMYKLVEECSNNQAEQLAIVRALEKLHDFRHLQDGQRSAAIHTDSKITLDATANPRNHQNLIEQIREGVRKLFFFFLMPPHVHTNFRGPPSWLWRKCNRLLSLGRP